MESTDSMKLPASKWIVFEGLDGAGTTTQAKMLAQALLKMGVSPSSLFLTEEPSQGPFGKICREALKGQHAFSARAMALAFCADRAHHLEKEDGILARRRLGHWVIQDRYFYSTLAYQDTQSREWLLSLCASFPHPDLIIYLETPPDTCLKRIMQRSPDREIFEEERILQRVAQSYEWALRETASPDLILRLDGEAAPEEIHCQILRRLLMAGG